MLSIRLNGEPQVLDEATLDAATLHEGTLAELLAARGIERRRGVAVAVNGTVVPAKSWADHRLADGDAVEIVRPIGGG